MLEFVRLVTITHTHSAPLTIGSYHSKVEYLYNGNPICIHVSGADHSMTVSKACLSMDFIKPDGPTVPGETSKYEFIANNGRDIDDVVFYNYYAVKRAMGVYHYSDKFPEQNQVFVPEYSTVISCLGIMVPDVKNPLKRKCIPLADYLAQQKRIALNGTRPDCIGTP